MKRLKIILIENWKDPVWSGVMAAVIFSCLTALASAFYSVISLLFHSVPIKESLNNIISFFNEDISVKSWLLISLAGLYAILIFRPLLTFIVEAKRKYLERNKSSAKVSKPKLPRARHSSTSFFSYRMAKAFPGLRGITWINNPATAIDRLKILLRDPVQFEPESDGNYSDPVWWFRGGRNASITKFIKLNRNTALMNSHRLKIKRIAAHHSDSYYLDFVYVEVKGEKKSGASNIKTGDVERHIENFGYSHEEYGLRKNRIGWSALITREEYDDGATVIGGNVLDASDSELRIRYLSKYNFIIAAKGSPFNSREFDKESKDYFDQILSNEADPKDFFEILKQYRKTTNNH